MFRAMTVLLTAVLACAFTTGCSTSQVKPTSMAGGNDAATVKPRSDPVVKPSADMNAKPPADTSVAPSANSAPIVQADAGSVGTVASQKTPETPKPARKRSRPKPKRRNVVKEKVAVVDTTPATVTAGGPDSGKHGLSTPVLVGLAVVGASLAGFLAFKLFGMGGSAPGGPPVGPPSPPP